MNLQEVKSNYDKFLSLSPKMKVIYKSVMDQLTPFVRSLLKVKFDSAGLTDRTGDLRKCIDSSTLHLTKTGLRISPGGGFSKDVYIRLNTFTFGGVVGSGIKSKSIKKSIKKRGADTDGVYLIPGRGLYLLNSAERQSVIDKFNSLMEVELSTFLR